jgi:hypothetical protein
VVDRDVGEDMVTSFEAGNDSLEPRAVVLGYPAASLYCKDMGAFYLWFDFMLFNSAYFHLSIPWY